MNSNKLVGSSAALKTFLSRTSFVSSHPISGPNSLLNAQENVLDLAFYQNLLLFLIFSQTSVNLSV
jgi:hypothetical protein